MKKGRERAMGDIQRGRGENLKKKAYRDDSMLYITHSYYTNLLPPLFPISALVTFVNQPSSLLHALSPSFHFFIFFLCTCLLFFPSLLPPSHSSSSSPPPRPSFTSFIFLTAMEVVIAALCPFKKTTNLFICMH